jgi:hypothetical protein
VTLFIGVKEGNDSAVEVYTANTQIVPTDAEFFVLTHGLNDINSRLTSCYPLHTNGWYTTVTIVAKTTNDMTVRFSVPAPAGNSLDWRVDRSI